MTAGRSAAAWALCLAAVPAGAQVVLEPCGLEISISPPSPSPFDLLTVRMHGERGFCDVARLAAIGDPVALGLPAQQASATTNLVIGIRAPSGGGCPAVNMPFTLQATLPQPRPQPEPPAVDELGFFIRFEEFDGTLASLQACGRVPVPVAASAAHVLPLHGGRFHAEVDWNTSTATGVGVVSHEYVSATDSAGVFWFFNAHNPELLLKILNGCAVNGHWWVLGAASTTVGYTLRISDLDFDVDWTYTNPRGQASAAITDVNAFPCGVP